MVHKIRHKSETSGNAWGAKKEIHRAYNEFSRRFLQNWDADRRLAAKELHENIAVGLSSIKFNLEDLVAKQQDGEVIRGEQLEKIIKNLSVTIEESRRIATCLRPATLNDFGLMVTVEWFCRRFGRLHPNLKVRHHLRANEKEIDGLRKMLVFHIIQEAMSNTAKHSDADSIHIRIWKYRRRFCVKIEDNGQGFNTEKALSDACPVNGNGLKDLRERVEILDGCFSVTSHSDKGTVVRACFDLENIF